MNNSINDVYDGSDKILFSSSYNIHDNHLEIKNLLDSKYDLVILFVRDDSKKIDMKISNKDKIITINLINFYKTFGAATTQKIKLLEDPEENKQIYFSIYGNSIQEKNDFLVINITFYERKL